MGDNTGSGADNATNDIDVMWPSGRAPTVVATYYTGARASDEERNEVLSAMGSLAAAS